MARTVIREFPASSFAPREGSYRVKCCDAHVHVLIDNGGCELVMQPEDAYDFAQAILRGYDFHAGLGPEP